MTKTQQTSSDTMSVDKYYVERQAKWVKEVGLEVGDTVLVVADCVDFREQRPDLIMSIGTGLEPEYIGTPLFVDKIDDERIFVADRDCKFYSRPRAGRMVPFYVLIKING